MFPDSLLLELPVLRYMPFESFPVHVFPDSVLLFAERSSMPSFALFVHVFQESILSESIEVMPF